MLLLTIFASVALLFFTAWCVKQALQYFGSEVLAILICLLAGTLIAFSLLSLIKGVVPFIHGLRPSFKVYLVVWLVCGLIQVAKVVEFEITGNIIVDAIITGFITAGIAVLISAGLWTLINQGFSNILLYRWLVGSLFVSIILRSLGCVLE